MNKLAVGTSLVLALSVSLLDFACNMAMADAAADQAKYVQTYGSSSSTTTSTVHTQTTSTQTAPKSPQIPAPPNWQTTTVRGGSPVQTTTVTTSKAATTTTASAASSKSKKDEESFVIAQSQPHVSPKAGWQKYYDMIQLKQGQDDIPLTLTFTNGASGRPAFQTVKLELSGHPLATQKDFKNNAVSMKLDGAVSVGDNQLTITAFGPAGASCDWKVTSIRPQITSISPEKEIKGGMDLTIKGKYFGDKASAVKAWLVKKGTTEINNTTVKSCKPDEIVVTVPTDVTGGEKNLQVEIAGKRTRFFAVSVGVAPCEVTGVSLISGPPGSSLTIYGKNFSTKSSENQVTIAGVAAPVDSCTATSIVCIIPELPQDPQWGCAVNVKSFGVQGKSTITVAVQKRFIPNDGVPLQ